MKTIHDVTIEDNRVVAPQGQFPFNSKSAVYVRLIRKKQRNKKIIAGGLFATSIVTGGLALLLAIPATLSLVHGSYEIVLSTNGTEFVIRQFCSTLGENESNANALKDAIAEAISKLSE